MECLQINLETMSGVSRLPGRWPQENVMERDRKGGKLGMGGVCLPSSSHCRQLELGPSPCWTWLGKGAEHSSVTPAEGRGSWRVYPPDTLSVLGWLLTPLVCSASGCRLYCVWNKPLVRAVGTDSGQGCGTHRQDAHTAHSPSASPRAVPGWRPTLACRSSRDGSARTTTGSPASRRGSRCPGRSKPAPHPRLSVLSCRGASL